MQPSQHYAGIANLRPFGIDCLLHYRCKHAGNGSHKLEMFNTGSKPYSSLVAQVEAVVNGQIDSLEMMRIDLCADIPDVPVSWFHSRMRIRYKRLSHTIGPVSCQTISRAGIETISAGRRPNILRIYDKVAESQMQFRRMCRQASKDSDTLEFEKEFGFSTNSVLTRVERQFGGGRIPEPLSTFGQLANAAAYNPFDILEITGDTGASLPTVQECGSVTEYLAGKELHRMVSESGLQSTRRWLNAQTTGNGARTLKHYHRFLPGSDADSLSVERICKIFQESVAKQLGA